MKLVAISSGLVCLVLGLAACGGGAASGEPASMPAAEPQPQAQVKAPDGVEIGSACGESWRPEVHQWQSAMLKATGRDGQYALFDYVFVNGKVYVGLRTAPLGLTDAELDAARQVDAQYAQGPVSVRERGDLLMVDAFAMPVGGAVAQTE